MDQLGNHDAQQSDQHDRRYEDRDHDRNDPGPSAYCSVLRGVKKNALIFIIGDQPFLFRKIYNRGKDIGDHNAIEDPLQNIHHLPEPGEDRAQMEQQIYSDRQRDAGKEQGHRPGDLVFIRSVFHFNHSCLPE